MHCNFVGQPHDHPHEDEIEEDHGEPHDYKVLNNLSLALKFCGSNS